MSPAKPPEAGSLRRWLRFLPPALAALAFCGTIGNDFLWDDEALILGNPLIRSARLIPDILTSSFWAGSGDYYRPLPILSFLLDNILWGVGRPWGFHLTNVLLHALFTGLLYRLLRRRFGAAAAFWAAALYGVHPVHAASVAPAFGRDNILPALWVPALAAFDRSPSDRRAAFACLGFYSVSLLAKESAVVFPLIAAAYYFLYFDPEQRPRTRPLLGALFAAAGLYLLSRWLWMPFRVGAPLSLIAEEPLPVRLWTFLRAIASYLGLLVFPWRLHTERHFVAGALDPLAWAGLAGVAAALYAAWSRRREQPHLLFGLLWFLIALGPVSNIVPLTMSMAEQWLYLPALGAAWTLAGVLDRSSQAGRLRARAGLCAVVLLFTLRARSRSQDWKDGPTLYAKDLRYAKHSFLLHTNLGVILFRDGKMPEAEREFRAALAINPSYGTALNNLGAIEGRKGNIAAAEAAYRRALEKSDYELAYLNLAQLLIQTGRVAEGAELLRRGQLAHPYNPAIAVQLEQLERALRPR